MKFSASPNEEINRRILLVSEDCLKGFYSDPIREIARRTRLKLGEVIERIRVMMQKGAIRSVRQTIDTSNLIPGALVAWKIPENRLAKAFEFMSKCDPFSGHVVIRSAEYSSSAAGYRLWTTLKIPKPYSLKKHCEFLKTKFGAEKFQMMPIHGVFALDVGHSYRKNMPVGLRDKKETSMKKIRSIKLNALEWKVFKILKREFKSNEIQLDLWRPRAAEAGLSFEKFIKIAKQLEKKSVLGKFSTILEHSKMSAVHALLQWAVPKGKEESAGKLIAQFKILTHCYWRKTSPEFCNANIFAVIHSDSKKKVLDHKKSIDQSLAQKRIPILHTNIFWSEKSKIKPSEIDTDMYKTWRRRQDVKLV